MRRILRALARRIGDADPEDLAEMVKLRSEIDDVIEAAVASQRSRETSWHAIGRALGITAAQALERYDPEARERRLERDRVRKRQERRSLRPGRRRVTSMLTTPVVRQRATRT